MAKRILLDTSFLIALVDSNDNLNLKAHSYLDWFQRTQSSLIISTIALSEYCVKNDSSDLVYGLSVTLPVELPTDMFDYLFFNYRDAVVAGELFSSMSCKNENKDCLKDDFKIIAQAQNNQIDSIVTADSRLIRRMTGTSLNFDFIDINNPVSDYTGELPLCE